MHIVKSVQRPLVHMMDGVHRRTMVWGDRMLLAEILLDSDGEVPTHDHPYEQLGYCISGRFDLVIDGVRETIERGMSWVIAAGLPHGATAHEPSFLIEIWSPARDDFKD